MEFEDKTGAWHTYGINVGVGISDILIDELDKSGRFIVIERARLNEILDEQGLGASGLVDPSTAARIGGVAGVQVLVMGSVTVFTIERKGIGLPGLANISAAEAKVQIQVRAVDANTGQVLMADSAMGTASSASVSLGIADLQGLSFTSADFHQSILGQATLEAVQQVMAKIR